MEPSSGFEPETPALPWRCSTTELRRHLQGVNIAENALKAKYKTPVKLYGTETNQYRRGLPASSAQRVSEH